jgi:uncharacterized protein
LITRLNSFPIDKEADSINATDENERIENLDILRGFALFGVIVINLSVDTVWSKSYVTETPGNVDNIIAMLLQALGAGKFLTIFSFLFGLGVFMQIQRCTSRSVAFVPLLLRRLSVLLLIGLMHYLLVGWTDILHVYALLGMLLLFFHRCSARMLLITAIVLLLLNIGDPKPLVVMAGEKILASPVIETAAAVIDAHSISVDPIKSDLEHDQLSELVAIYASGNYRQILQANLDDFGGYVRDFAARWWIGSLFPVILLGAYAAKRRILQKVEEHTVLLHRVFWWGLVLGLTGSALTLVGETLWDDRTLSFCTLQLKSASDVIGVRALGFAYASGLLLLLQKRIWNKRLIPLGAVGRTAFTNYLLQTVVAVILFYGVGFGLYGSVNPVLGALIAIVTFIIQILLSRWWLTRFRFGPVEWLWRSLTYGRLQKMRH